MSSVVSRRRRAEPRRGHRGSRMESGAARWGSAGTRFGFEARNHVVGALGDVELCCGGPWGGLSHEPGDDLVCLGADRLGIECGLRGWVRERGGGAEWAE